MIRSRILNVAVVFSAIVVFGVRGTDAVPVNISGVVFQDTNQNGQRDARESGLAGVILSDGVEVVRTNGEGRYHLSSQNSRVLFVCLPHNYLSNGDFYEYLRGHEDGDEIHFPMLKHPSCDQVSFLFFTDAHVTPQEKFNAVAGMKAAVAHMNGQQRVDLVISGGDLIMDALRACEPESRQQYLLYRKLIANLDFPLFNAIGNHELFGVYLDGVGDDPCIVQEDDDLYGVGLYREYLGPDYYSFNWGRYHFMVLNTISLTRVLNDDGDTVRVYYGNVAADQIAWMKKDLTHVSPETPIILIGHIPFMTAAHTFEGFNEYQTINYDLNDPTASSYTHVVSNAAQVINEVLAEHRFILALAGHHHHHEEIRWADSQHDALFVTGGSICGQWWQGDRRIAGSTWPEGYLLVRLKDGKVDDLEYISFDWKGYEE
jgi:Icc protein